MKLLTVVQYEKEKATRLQSRIEGAVREIERVLQQVQTLRASSQNTPVLTYEEHEELESAERSLNFRRQTLIDAELAPGRKATDLKLLDSILKHTIEILGEITHRISE